MFDDEVTVHLPAGWATGSNPYIWSLSQLQIGLSHSQSLWCLFTSQHAIRVSSCSVRGLVARKHWVVTPHHACKCTQDCEIADQKEIAMQCRCNECINPHSIKGSHSAVLYMQAECISTVSWVVSIITGQASKHTLEPQAPWQCVYIYIESHWNVGHPWIQAACFIKSKHRWFAESYVMGYYVHSCSWVAPHVHLIS